MVRMQLTKDNIEAFSYLIPPTLLVSWEKGELAGSGEADEKTHEAVSVALFREWHGWMELVWVAVVPERRGQLLASWLIWQCVSEAWIYGKVIGAFVDLPEGESGHFLRRIFDGLGAEFARVNRPVYSITAEELKATKLYRPESDFSGIRALKDADPELLKAAQRAMEEGDVPVPFDASEGWEPYDGELSALCVQKDRVEGVILVSREEHLLILSLLWSVSPVCTPYLLMYAANKACALFPPQTEIVVPTVTEMSKKLVEKLLPKARQQVVEQAKIHFLPDLSKLSTGE